MTNHEKKSRHKMMISTGLAFLLWGVSAEASFTFSPISANLTTTGKDRALVATVTNTGSEKIPILIHIFKRSLDESGKEIRNPTTDLSVFPAQFTLDPKEQKNVQIVWRGPAELNSEEAYRCLVEELPIDFSPKAKNAGQIRILLNYDAAFYVTSHPVAPDVKLTSVEPVDGGRRVKMTLSNLGDGHIALVKPEIGLKCADDKKDATTTSKEDFYFFKESSIKSFSSKNLLAKSKLVTKALLPTSLQKCTKFAWIFNGDK